MQVSEEQIDTLAQSLLDARLNHRHHPRPSELGLTLTVDQAYAIQMRQRQLLASHDREIAIKLGLTTPDQRLDAGFDAPSFGFLTESMVVGDGGELSLASSIAPRVEPELVVVLGAEVQRAPGSRQELLDSIDSVRVGIEVVDARYASGGFQLSDALADNSSAHLGVWSSHGVGASDRNWAAVEVVLDIDGEVVARGSTAAIMGDPLVVVQEVIAERLDRGWGVPAGLAIFTGNAAPPAVAVRAGNRVTAHIDGVGSVSLKVVD